MNSNTGMLFHPSCRPGLKSFFCVLTAVRLLKYSSYILISTIIGLNLKSCCLIFPSRLLHEISLFIKYHKKEQNPVCLKQLQSLRFHNWHKFWSHHRLTQVRLELLKFYETSSKICIHFQCSVHKGFAIFQHKWRD